MCHCHALTDRDIGRAVRATGASSVADVGDQCGAATACSGCYEVVAEVVGVEKRRLAVFSRADEHTACKPDLEQALPAPDLALTG